MDKKVTSSRQAFLEGLTAGLKNPSGKGKRFIISHIGSEEGFLEEGLMIFEAKKNCEDYHDEMNAVCFEEWFAAVLPKLRPNSIVVMDNAPYHSRKLETAPKMSWKKAAIQYWLLNKNIHYEPDMVKATLLELIPHNESFNKYAVDEMAAQHGITVLRLPPYHCELNPIELIWAQIKGHVARNNKTFKLTDVRNLFQEGIKKITATEWSKCVSHVVKEEEKMSRLDVLIDNITDTFIINVTESDSDSDSDDGDNL